jgi:hypothetical protein
LLLTKMLACLHLKYYWHEWLKPSSCLIFGSLRFFCFLAFFWNCGARDGTTVYCLAVYRQATSLAFLWQNLAIYLWLTLNSLSSPGCPQTHNLPASTSKVLRLKAPAAQWFFLFVHFFGGTEIWIQSLRACLGRGCTA